MSLHIDLTEFLGNPITTGIQRVLGEICRHAPAGWVVPVRLERDGYRELPIALMDAIKRLFIRGSGAAAEEIRQLGRPENGKPITLSGDDNVLVPEVFDTPYRVAFFNRMREDELRRVRFIVYDLLPLTRPEYFIAASAVDAYGYFRMLTRATDCGFISEETRDDYFQRLKRTDATSGVVLPLGSDSLGPRTPPVRNRPLKFVVVGTIEPRKNHRLILDAFRPLLGKVPGLQLTFLGRIGWVEPDLAAEITSLATDANSSFEHIPAPSDGLVREHISSARATIYVSTAEGYGLPPVESLWLGTPVIASRAIPSLKRLPRKGIEYTQELDPDCLREIVQRFRDDNFANRKIEETAQLDLPTWRSFANEVLRWCGVSKGSDPQ
ncbi:MAG TPA: glycosyltransferase [Bryobacteraceae bacterium]|jgi:glycosyltransferase involved in cell wall biosynthesis|nr:glycosyltransferase [Bryobacteraceae bacterium]